MPNNLARIRRQRGQTQDQAAVALDMPFATYVKIERGERGLCLPLIERAAKAWGVDPGEIVTAQMRRPSYGH